MALRPFSKVVASATTVASLVLGLLPTALAGQRPLSIGTAAGYGLAALTEARTSEASLWNPALAAIFDGPMSSFTLLGLTMEPTSIGTTRALVEEGFRFSEPTAAPVSADLRDLAGKLSHGEDVRLNVQALWVGIHSRDLLITLSSQGYGTFSLPERASGIIRGEETARRRPLSAPEFEQMDEHVERHAAASILAVAKGQDLGRVPLLGRTWVGGTLKAGYVHRNSRASYQYRDETVLIPSDSLGGAAGASVDAEAGAYGLAYDEYVVRSAQVYSLDAGIVFNPRPYALLSLNLANLFQKAAIGSGAIEHRQVVVAGRDSVGRTYAFSRTQRLTREDIDAGSASRRRLIDGLARSTHFAPVATVGASVDTRMGRLMGGLTVPLETEPALFRPSLDRFSVAYQSLDSPLRPRVSYSVRFDGSVAITGGLQKGFCGDRWAVEAGWVRVPQQPDGVTIGLSWSRGGGPCGQFR